MNKEAVLKEFIGNNFKLLTSNNLKKKAYKKAYNSHFVKEYKGQKGRPSISEVCLMLVKVLLKRGIIPEKVRECIEILPIFNSVSESKLEELFSLTAQEEYETAFSQEEFEKIKKGGIYVAAKESLKREQESEFLERKKELEEALEEKRREVDFYPSVLDAKEIPEPDFDPEIEQYKHWWEKFYLKGNPFPTRAGLSDIDEQLYESIVVKTKPFKNTLSALEKDRQFLFKTAFLLVGNYGFPCVAPR